MEKRKIKTRVLAFASTFIILLTLLSTVVFAQALDFQSVNYSTILTCAYINNLDNTECLAFVNIYYTGSSQPYTISNIHIVFSEYFYNNIYTGDSYIDIDYLLDNNFNIDIRFLRQTATKHAFFENTDFVTALDRISTGTFSVGNYDTYYNAFETSYNSQFTYWLDTITRLENENEIAFDYGFAEGQQVGLQTGYNNGYSVGHNEGLTEGYTNALNDSDTFIQAIFKIFEAPFVFVQNITGFELFGIRVFDIFSFFIIISVGIFLFNKLRRFLPL